MLFADIWEKAYKLKVFQPWEVVDELHKEWEGIFSRSVIKHRVSTFIVAQLRAKALVKVNSEPPIYAFSEFAENWREYLRLRRCPICGKEFLPLQSTQEFCSDECLQRHYRLYHRKRRKKLGMKVDSKKRWSEEELQKAIALRKQGKTYKEIAQILGRTPEGVKDKLKRFARRG